MNRIALALIAGLVALPYGAHGQLRPQLGVRGSVIPLYGGGGEVPMASHWAGSIHGGAVVGRQGHGEFEAFYTIAPEDGYKPRMQMAGAMFGVRGSPGAPVAVAVSLGAGLIDVGPDDGASCGPPICFREGGPTFEEARLATIIGAIGVDVPLGGVTRLRFDARTHFPIGGDDTIGNSADPRVDIGVGIRALFP